MTTYRERLTAPISWWLAAIAFAVIWGWVFLVVTTWPIAIVAALVVAAPTTYAVWRYGSLLVAVDPDGVRVGPAFLEAAHLGTVTVLNRADYRTRLGTGADARAYLMTRPYLDHGVMIAIDDDSDPTPYWVVSSRDPEALALALDPAATRPTHHTIGEAPRGEEP